MTDITDLTQYMTRLGEGAYQASRDLSSLSTEQKNKALELMAESLSDNKEDLLEANKEDINKANESGISSALLDRLELNEDRIESMISGLISISKLPDPIGEITNLKPTPSGINVSQMRVPLGVVGIIYESRPNVTADAAGLCLKSGNACILRGGSESINSNLAIYKNLLKGLETSEAPNNSIQLVETVDREAVKKLLSMKEWIDVVIPRGGKGLVQLVSDEAKVPVIKHLDGICHVYIDGDCDEDKAVSIAVNAKTYRFGICGAMETLLVDRKVAKSILPKIYDEFTKEEVEMRGCSVTNDIISAAPASDEDWVTEYLAPIISIKVVEGIKEAIDHINNFGSSHSDCIVTEDLAKAELFLNKVDSSSVMHNVPTCWADGYEYGLGAEVGISTDKFHARGPVGLEGLTSQKYLVKGKGELRGN